MAFTAQSGEPPGSTQRRELTFSVFAAEPTSDAAYIPRPGAAAVPLEFYPTARSSSQKYRGPSPLEIFDRASGSIMATIDLPNEIRSALLIFLPGTRKGTFKTCVVDDDSAHHTSGETRIINLSGLVLDGTINRHRLRFPEGSDQKIISGNSVHIDLRTTFRERSYPAYSEMLGLGDGERALVLLLPPNRAGALEVQSRVLVDHSSREPRR
ncbi:MAG: hypothetical protein JWM35_592 [Verrucomicrobia bacterium]|nr:hypothetical protein [Verrucomicrobiota bacterium]